MTRDRFARLRARLAQSYRIDAEEESDAGAVYYARDLTLDRPVAIHVIDPALAGDARTLEFEREARVLAGLSHPHLRSVHFAGPVDEFRVVVYEHPDGETLEAQLGRAPLPWREVVGLGEQLLDALSKVHRAGLVHAAVTPRCIVEAGNRWVLDGAGRAVEAGGAASPADDLHAVGLVLSRALGDSSRTAPRRLRHAIARALSPEPARRWQRATDFREALGGMDDRVAPLRSLRWAPAAVGVGVGLYFLMRAPSPPPGPQPRDLAILPFEVDGGRFADSLGFNFAHLLRLELDNVPHLNLTPPGQVDRWWREQGGDLLGTEGSTAARRLRAHWVAHGLLDHRPGDSLRVRVTLYDSLGNRTALPELRARADALVALGEALAGQVLGVVSPRANDTYRPRAGLAGVPLGALKAFLQGEAAFARDGWALAERYDSIAVGLDSGFALAAWRLANVRRWRRKAYEPDLPEIYRRHGQQLPPSDRLILEALLEPDLHLRFGKLEEGIRAPPRDAYARLIYGDELFHRGPLAGVKLDSAVTLMDSAAALDSSLALAWDHLALAHIRYGRRELAGRVMDVRRRVGRRPRSDDPDLVRFLGLAYDERFRPLRAWAARQWIAWREDPEELAGIAQVLRTVLPVLDMPETQLDYADLLLRRGRPTLETYQSAREAKGLALVALGRTSEALAELDSSAVLLDTPEARLQQAEWRVIPSFLGDSLGDASDPHWLRSLEALTPDSGLGARAAWALALAALARGDTTTAAEWSGRIGGNAAPLRVLVEAMLSADRGAFCAALARTDSVRPVFQSGRPPDTFAGAVFFLSRGDWRAALGDRGGAEREWLWHEASDVAGWPSGLAQAGEVDAALGRLVRQRGTRLEREPAEPAMSCMP